MKLIACIVVGLSWAAILSAPNTEESIRLAVELTDGSRVIGTPQKDSIRLVTDFGDQSVSLKLVTQVLWKPDREHVVLEFPNGDRLTGAIVPEDIQLRTLFGDTKISMEHIVMLKPLPATTTSVASLDGLVLYLPFDEDPKSVVSSRAGQLQGRRQGGQWLSEAKRGGSFQFANGQDGIRFTDDPALRPKNLTISVWVNPDKMEDSSSSYRGILAKSGSGSWTNGFGLARLPNSPDVHFFVNYYGADTAHAPIPDGTWTHVACTYDEQTLTLYLNGTKVSSVVPKAPYAGPIQYDNSPMLVGQAPDGYGWFGKIDELMIFNRVLSESEIKRLSL
ncbi:MAG: LamG domain-containing protein [Planctomycetaceae bacterium]|nr:LamG domain-containing protein [Planctomycetaceae bacterium]